MKHLSIALACLLALAGCYEDKGNYVYRELEKIEIEQFSTGTISIKQGGVLDIEPQLAFANGAEPANLAYAWTLDGEVISRERHLVYTCNKLLASTLLVLDVHDLDTDLHFTQSVFLSVTDQYSGQGFYILSNDNGQSRLHLLLGDAVGRTAPDFEADPPTAHMDLYQQVNGEPLPGHPVRVHEHYCKGGNGPQALVIAREGLVDIQSSTYLKDIDGAQMFGGSWPGIQVANFMYMGWLDLLEDTEGRIYTRLKSTNQLYNSEYFLTTPTRCHGEDEPLADTHIIPAKFKGSFCLLQDNRKKRLLTASDNKENGFGTGESTVGKISTLDLAKWDEGFIPLNNWEGYELIHCGYYAPYQYGGSGNHYFMIFRKDGQYHCQTCIIMQDGFMSSGITVTEMKPFDFSKQPGTQAELQRIINERSVIYTLPYNTQYENPGDLTFISSGNDLYLYDRTGNTVKKHLSFNSPVAAMDAEWYGSNYMAVGLENGEFYILQMQNAKNLSDGQKIAWKSPDNFGRIVDIRYKGAQDWGVDN